ncbi:MAG: 3D domain-containing protein [Patescibacteria group bacterium]
MKKFILFAVLIWGPLVWLAQFLVPDTIPMTVTAYCLCEQCCGEWACETKRVTSIGDDAHICDGVAADPKLIPYRTRLWIPGVGEREVDDTGGRMRQDAKKGIWHIDLRMESHEAARAWGIQKLDVTIL